MFVDASLKDCIRKILLSHSRLEDPSFNVELLMFV